ncbi:putative phage abortive infection protein [Cellulophaga baltica]|uniref:putative phage abortive infection protein n=1 Tax=Cellulophaga baltica TaxID=76594 RepID=UPI0015F47473|nr:putative phage abortive infection protein [Cellulophaga baltica]
MEKAPNNIKEEKYLGLGIKYLIYGLVLIFIMIFLACLALFSTDASSKEIGSFLSGTIGAIIAFLVAFFTFLAFYFQYEANNQIQAQFKIQKTNDHFYKMLDIHLKNIDSFNINSYRLENNDDQCEIFNGNKTYISGSFKEAFKEMFITIPSASMEINEIPDLIIKNIKNYYINVINTNNNLEQQIGKRAFLVMTKDFHFCHYSVINANQFFNCELSIEECNELAYRIFFWGTYSNHIYGDIEKEKKNKVDDIKKYLSLIRKTFRENKGAKYSFRYKTHEGDTSISLRFIPFSGHSSRLAHYYRHLYQTVKFLYSSHEDKLITDLELDSNLKVLRAQFTNEEVLLLYYNYRIGFGKNWDQRGEHDHRFFREYNLLHNIPLYDNIPKTIEHPLDHFAVYITKQRTKDNSYKMFEWE